MGTLGLMRRGSTIQACLYREVGASVATHPHPESLRVVCEDSLRTGW